MHKSRQILIILCIISLPFLVLFKFSKSQKDERLLYEDFLNTLYQKSNLNTPQEQKETKPDNPDAAALREYITTLDPNIKRVPKERLLKAYKYAKSKKQKRKSSNKKQIEWNNIPANIAGRIRKIVLDPSSNATNKKLWAGSVTGGLWFNNDATNPNSEWQNIPGFFENLSIGAIVFDVNNPDIMYIGTGESYTAVNSYRESSGRGGGIWKSTDHGVTWNLLPSTVKFAYTNDILIRDESGNSVLYAAIASGTYKGSIHGSDSSNGLYRSIDGGSSWKQVLPNILGKDVPYTPSDITEVANGKLLIGTMRNSNDEGAGVILNSINGVDWNIDNSHTVSFDPPNNLFPGRVKLAVAPTNNNRIYALITGGTKSEGEDFIRGHSSYTILIQSFDAGETWSRITLPSSALKWGAWGTLTWHAMGIGVDAANENTIMIGGFNTFKLTNTNNADNTESTALKWQCMSYWFTLPSNSPPYVHADIHTILYCPNSSDEVFISTDGGVFYSNNVSRSNVKDSEDRTNIYPSFIGVNKGLNTIQYYTLAVHPNKSNNYYLGGTQDNGTLEYNNTPITVANMVTGGDGCYTFIDQDSPNTAITSVYYNRYYISRDNGNTFNLVEIEGVSGDFISPADYDNNKNMLFSNGMYTGRANQNTNIHIDELLRLEIKFNTVTPKFIKLNTGSTVPYSCIKVSPHTKNSSTVFVGTQSGKLFKATNADTDSPIVKEIGGNSFPTANISSIAIGKNEQELVVTFSNYGVSSVWYTDNGGETWKDKELNLPDMPIRWAVFNPTNFLQLFLATEIGIWTIDDITSDTSEWYPNSKNLGNVRTDMIKIRKSDNKIVAATHGRGMFDGNISSPKPTPTPETPVRTSLVLYPNPIDTHFTISGPESIDKNQEVSIFDINGKLIRKIQYTLENKINTSSISSGIYLIKIKDKNDKETTFKVVKK